MTEIKTYKIYTRWLAFALRKQGFKIIGTDINEYHPQFDVWLFEDSPELQAAISKLSKNHKQSG